MGEWEGLLFKNLRTLPLWKQVQRQPAEVRFPGGESFLELQERLVNEIEAICAAHKRNDMIAVVFHCDPIKLVLAHYVGLPLNNFQKLMVSPGSVSVLMLGRSATYLVALNLKPPFVF